MVILRYILVVTLVFSSFLFASNLETGSTVVPNDKEYFKYKDEKSNIELLYSKENLKFAKETLKTDVVVVKEYQKLFDWKLDETLYVGLISSNNQIANGFSTQWPNNRQVNYMGGTQMVDYFTSTSWLKTLLYHEAAHNYQVNAKKSGITQVLHSVFGNGSFIVPFIPITLPNSFENSFMLEGNAVLNESWHGNGGRLYSGRFFVQTLLQAKANKIIPQDVYNKKMAFPYGETHYITGGFYNLYMAKRYGLKKINSYFLNHSQYWYWPFITDESMRESVGVSFEDSLEEFSKSYADIAKNVVLADGKKLITSQFFYPLNSDKNEIFFMVNTTGVQAPKLIRIDKKSLKIKKYKDSWLSGKVIKNNGKYYTQNSRYISTTKIYQGLFDSDGFIKKSTASKMIQGYLSDFTEVYFDVASSYSQPQLYVGKNFYGQVNSSVFIDEDDNLYYFKQDAKHRTLYKNKKPLFTYEGFYGIVSDVDSCGSVYFIANSKYGSTLYKYINGSVFRVLKADNVIDAKLIDKQKVLVSAISDKDYYYSVEKLVTLDEKPFDKKLFFEDKNYYAKDSGVDIDTTKVDISNPYNSFLDMHYSKTELQLAYINSSVVGEMSLNFGDPLSQNFANLFINRDDSKTTIAGIGYNSSLYLLKYSFKAYLVVDKNDRYDIRDSGFMLDAVLPFYKSGYYYGSLEASFYQDYDTLKRKPLSFAINFLRSEKFGNSLYHNYLSKFKLYATRDRDDNIYGASYNFEHDLAYEFYVSLGAKYSKTDADTRDRTANIDSRGVKITNTMFSLELDPTIIDMPSIDNSAYFKEIAYAQASIKKVINLPAYFFVFPISLQREAIFSKYRHYNIGRFSDSLEDIKINEISAGMTFSTVLFNNIELPVSLEYIYNDDDSGLVQNRENFRIVFGVDF